MREVYRKSGRTVRWENDHVIIVREAGEATEEEGRFVCRPVQRGSEVAPETAEVEEVVQRLRAAVPHPLSIERLVVMAGEAQHELDGKRWQESFRRVHLAMTHRRLRALIDLADFDVDGIRRVADAMLLPAGSGHPAGLRLAPCVSAALLRDLICVAPPNVEIRQTAGGNDGKVQPIDDCAAGQ